MSDFVSNDNSDGSVIQISVETKVQIIFKNPFSYIVSMIFSGMVLKAFHRLYFEAYIRFLTLMNFSFIFVTFTLGFLA